VHLESHVLLEAKELNKQLSQRDRISSSHDGGEDCVVVLVEACQDVHGAPVVASSSV
jgi:hypothetical protein